MALQTAGTTRVRSSRARSIGGAAESPWPLLYSPVMATEVLGYDCWGGDEGLRHANVVQLGMTPEEAMLRLLERVRQKYGEKLELSGWSWRAEPILMTSGAVVVRFKLEGGRFVRT
jgi:hypothetical protein